MTFKLIDATIALAKEHVETLRFKVRACKSQQELDNLRRDIQNLLEHIDNLNNEKVKILTNKFSDV